MKLSSTTATALTLLMCAPLIADAGPGQGKGPGDGTGPINPFDAATCENITGTVQAVGTENSGYVIDTVTGAITLFGMGPTRYWDSIGVTRPDVGETIVADVCWLTYNDGEEKAVATSITLSDATVVALRDPITGQPVWRGGPGAGQGAGASR